jgi:hypothetical protein
LEQTVPFLSLSKEEFLGSAVYGPVSDVDSDLVLQFASVPRDLAGCFAKLNPRTSSLA